MKARKKPLAKPAAKRSAKKSEKAKLPAALAENSRAAHAAKLKRDATKARGLLAHIRERQSDVASNMVDIGLALTELKADGMVRALGRASFAEVCALDLKMAVSTANSLIALATRVSRELTTEVGTDRASALLELTDATPEDDTPEGIVNATLTLPSGETLDVAAASNQALRAAAKEIRASLPGATARRSRGFSASPEAKAEYATIVERLKKHAKAPAVRASLVATRDKRGPKVRLEVRLSELAALAEALKAATKG